LGHNLPIQTVAHGNDSFHKGRVIIAAIKIGDE